VIKDQMWISFEVRGGADGRVRAVAVQRPGFTTTLAGPGLLQLHLKPGNFPLRQF